MSIISEAIDILKGNNGEKKNQLILQKGIKREEKKLNELNKRKMQKASYLNPLKMIYLMLQIMMMEF